MFTLTARLRGPPHPMRLGLQQQLPMSAASLVAASGRRRLGPPVARRDGGERCLFGLAHRRIRSRSFAAPLTRASASRRCRTRPQCTPLASAARHDLERFLLRCVASSFAVRGHWFLWLDAMQFRRWPGRVQHFDDCELQQPVHDASSTSVWRVSAATAQDRRHDGVEQFSFVSRPPRSQFVRSMNRVVGNKWTSAAAGSVTRDHFQSAVSLRRSQRRAWK